MDTHTHTHTHSMETFLWCVCGLASLKMFKSWNTWITDFDFIECTNAVASYSQKHNTELNTCIRYLKLRAFRLCMFLRNVCTGPPSGMNQGEEWHEKERVRKWKKNGHEADKFFFSPLSQHPGDVYLYLISQCIVFLFVLGLLLQLRRWCHWDATGIGPVCAVGGVRKHWPLAAMLR